MKKLNNLLNKNEKGQSLIELAVSLIILLILLSAIVDVGRIAFYYIAIRDSAQEGASFGSIFPHNCDDITKRVKAGVVDSSRIIVTVNINGNSCQSCPDNINIACPVVKIGDSIEVIVKDEKFPITMPLIGVLGTDRTIKLETSIQEKIIRIPDCKCK